MSEVFFAHDVVRSDALGHDGPHDVVRGDVRACSIPHELVRTADRSRLLGNALVGQLQRCGGDRRRRGSGGGAGTVKGAPCATAVMLP